MVRMQRRKEFPLFFHYNLFQILATLGLYPLYRMALVSHTASRVYFDAYWAATAVTSFLGFAVIHEVFKNAFKPFDALRDLASILFRWALLVVLLVAAVLAFSNNAGDANSVTVAIILSIERSVLVMQGGMLLFLMLFSTRLGLSWKQHGFGIALGFGLYACGELINNLLWARYGAKFDVASSVLQMVLGTFQIFVWLGYLARPEPARVAVASFEPKPILQRWDAVLGNRPLATQGAFLVNLEKIVDHVMEERPTGTR
jgi:hypothetical protein